MERVFSRLLLKITTLGIVVRSIGICLAVVSAPWLPPEVSNVSRPFSWPLPVRERSRTLWIITKWAFVATFYCRSAITTSYPFTVGTVPPDIVPRARAPLEM